MSFFFDCPFCGKEMKCADECDGEIINCPHCNEEVVAERFKKPVSNDGIYRSTNRMSATDRLTSSCSRTAYIFLCIFFGSFGIHNFYAGYVGEGAVQLTLSIISAAFFTLGIFGILGGDAAGIDFAMFAWCILFVVGTWCFVNLFRNEDAKKLKMKW